LICCALLGHCIIQSIASGSHESLEDLELATSSSEGPTGALLLLAASSLGSGGACLFLPPNIAGYFALDFFLLGSIV
jgi:hypothetical protein